MTHAPSQMQSLTIGCSETRWPMTKASSGCGDFVLFEDAQEAEAKHENEKQVLLARVNLHDELVKMVRQLRDGFDNALSRIESGTNASEESLVLEACALLDKANDC